MSIKQILVGHLNELINRGEDLYDMRIQICKKCPLYKEGKLGPICNPELYLNLLTNETNHIGGEGYGRGCGCRLNAKTRLEDAECPNNKW
jgi:hypothetical protein